MNSYGKQSCNQNILKKVNETFLLTHVKKQSQKNYMSAIKNFLKFHADIDSEEDINLEKVREFLKYLLHDKKRQIGTVNNYRSALKYLVTIVLRGFWCDKQIPVEKGYKTHPAVLSHKETMRLINSAGTIMFYTIFLLMYSSGMRVSEALSLRISDIDSAKMQINVRQSKNGSARKVILSPKALPVLRKYFKEDWLKKHGKYDREDFLFCSNSKQCKLSYTTIQKELNKAASKARIQKKVTCHTLRHNFALALMENGVQISTIKELMGHSSIRSTTLYTKLADYVKMGIKSPLEYEEGSDEIDTTDI